MANNCYTDIILKGNNGDRLKELQKGLQPANEGRFDIQKFFRDNYGYRSEDVWGHVEFVDDVEISKGTNGKYSLHIFMESRWTPDLQFFYKFAQEYDFTLLYFAEELGWGILWTNDKEGKEFSHYLLRDWDTTYCDNFNELLEELVKMCIEHGISTNFLYMYDASCSLENLRNEVVKKLKEKNLDVDRFEIFEAEYMPIENTLR